MTFNLESISVVIAIDFGTSRSGYAYAFTANKEVIGCTQYDGQPVEYAKTLTHLLYSPKREVHAWGWQASKTLAYVKETFEGAEKGYYFFQNFKMQLRESKKKTKESPVITNNGEIFFVLDVIADYLNKIKDLALKNIKDDTVGYLKDSEILWCLTIPAIWTDAEKQLMRRAAQQAGISTEAERLVLVLEPEAAAIYCQKNEISQLRPGTRFMVVDCGGGTVDITVHEVVEGGGLIEIAEGTGGAYGSTYVDRSFLDYLKKKLTPELLEEYEKDKPVGYLEMMRAWERMKCDFNPQESREVIYFSIEAELYKLIRNSYPEIWKRLLEEQDGDDTRIHIKRETIKDIFAPTLNGLVKTAKEQFDKLETRKQKCDYLFLVGGFSDSPLLQQMIEENFREKVTKIVKPSRASGSGAAIVEGAVYYGLSLKDGKPVSQRFSRLTYGCKVSQKFQAGDKEDKKFWSKDHQADYCNDCFDIFIEAGEAVKDGDRVHKTYFPLEKNQTEVRLEFYTSPNNQVRYIDEEGAKFIGEIVVELPDTTDGLKREVDVIVDFAGTEIKVEAEDKKSGKKYNTTLNFTHTDSALPKHSDGDVTRDSSDKGDNLKASINIVDATKLLIKKIHTLLGK